MKSPSTKTSYIDGNKVVWQRGIGNKKYKVVIFFKDGRKKTIQFGDKRYEQYKDSTPLKLYTRLNHGDKERRRLYKCRHEGIDLQQGALSVLGGYDNTTQKQLNTLIQRGSDGTFSGVGINNNQINCTSASDVVVASFL